MSDLSIPVGVNLNPRLNRWLMDHVSPGSRRVVNVDHVFGSAVFAVERIRHRLGTTPSGFRVVSQDRVGTIYQAESPSPPGTTFDRTHLYLKSSVAGVTVRLEVF